MPLDARSKAASRWSAKSAPARPVGPYDWLCTLLCLAAALLLACGPLGRWVWAADVVNLFRPYAAAATALTLLACLLARRAGLIAFAAVLMLGEAVLLSAPLIHHEVLSPTARGGRPIKVITFNCLGSNPHADAFVAWARIAKPDVLVLEELPNDWNRTLATLSDVLPYRASQLQDVPGDTEVFSRLPMITAQAYRPAQDLRTLVHATLSVDGKRLQVFGLHPNTLQTPSEWRYRNEALELSAQWIAQTRGHDPAIALGDWNTPPWSPYFHTFMHISGLEAADPVVWPPMTRVLAAPWGVRLGSSIDHIAATPDIHVLSCQTGPQMGSDHAPQICSLELPPA